jgi:DNA polymerase-3 subunit epsilon/ATP-dependent DNA helicase DinG
MSLNNQNKDILSNILDEKWISLDLETTGLDAKEDKIIEIGAVRFDGEKTLETFESFINPSCKLSDFTKTYTGINQLDIDNAPTFNSINNDLKKFIGDSPILGHNIQFDINFLKSHGLNLKNNKSDTWDLAYILFPQFFDYSLIGLSKKFKVGHEKPHRALDDAIATKGVFENLILELLKIDYNSFIKIKNLANKTKWIISYLMNNNNLLEIMKSKYLNDNTNDLYFKNILDLFKEMPNKSSLKPNDKLVDLNINNLNELLVSENLLSGAVKNFKKRPQQISMSLKIAESINNNRNLIVEAGTGVGKSLAYLFPSILYSIQNKKRIVISTNTINLQEQLIQKDLPNLKRLISKIPGFDNSEFDFNLLKGRSNYICLKKWQTLQNNENINVGDARIISKTNQWIHKTVTGDKNELNLGHPGVAFYWDHISAQGAIDCPDISSPCFLRLAREKANFANVLVVNHSLLISDIVSGGSLIPDYDILVIDEAHHLEDEVSSQFGFNFNTNIFNDLLSDINKQNNIWDKIRQYFINSNFSDTRINSFNNNVSNITKTIDQIFSEHTELCNFILSNLINLSSDENKFNDIRITSTTRKQPIWSDFEIQWQNSDNILLNLINQLEEMNVVLEDLDDNEINNYSSLKNSFGNLISQLVDIRNNYAELILNPKDDYVYWISFNLNKKDIFFNSAPLNVSDILEENIYLKKDSVILTSATLSTNGKFEHIRNRIGPSDADELLLDSPFDYFNSSLLCVPGDLPELFHPNYMQFLSDSISKSTIAVGGSTLALFTSHELLRKSSKLVRPVLESNGISCLVQGVDGTPAQLIKKFINNPKSILMGTNSFWEGIDLPGDLLKLLILSKLPFTPPNEPIFQARSELYENPFFEYAVPQAVLRLRQGFGRLIRTIDDRGVVIILDKRIISKKYGENFINSLPDLKIDRSNLNQIPDVIKKWFKK